METISFHANGRISLKVSGLSVGKRVGLRIDWPVLYGDRFPIVLAVWGTVLSCEPPGQATVDIRKREFQVQKTAVDGVAPPVLN